MERSKNFVALILVLLLACFTHARASTVVASDATKAAQGWLQSDRGPLGRALSKKIKQTVTINDAASNPLYHVVQLEPSGYVVVPANNDLEPIIAFSATGKFDPDSSTAAYLLGLDLPRRQAGSRTQARAKAVSKAHAKWNAFLAGSVNPPPDVQENGNIVVTSQIWVAPLTQTLWSQQVDVNGTAACYNYFTPPGAAGSTNNYPCGCVATALAQEMFYFKYPAASVGTNSFSITVDNVASNASLRGGNGAGGPYQWTNMPLSPNMPNPSQAMAIGALTHDAGAAVNMSYTASNSAAFTKNTQTALTNTFFYGNTAYFEDDQNGITGSNLLNMINPNLDAHLPVILGIEPSGGHCLLADGYGYSAGTLFHHLNTGFGGDDDIWYALPSIDTVDGNGNYTMVVACAYNIFTNATGQIISGRVTDPSGAPIAGASISAAKSGGGTFSATTDSNGVYALAQIPANSTYTITVSNTGSPAVMGTYATGASTANQLPSGNVWGANFVLTPPLLALPETGFSSIGPVAGPFSITAQIYALRNASASTVSWAVANTNNWLTVNATNGSLAAGASSNLIISLTPASTNLSAGVHSGTVWITNLANGLAQSLTFTLTARAADYPIAVTGYNLDVIVEKEAVGGSTLNYADTFDPTYIFLNPPAPACFYEAGLVATTPGGGGGAPETGLPTGGFLTSEADGVTTFQLAPYTSSNVLNLTFSAPAGSLSFVSPMACKSLTVLAASSEGTGIGSLVIHFSDGSVSTNIPYSASNCLWSNFMARPDGAWTNFGMLAAGSYNEYYFLDGHGVGPVLHQTTINLHALGYDTNLISSVAFTLPSLNSNAFTTNSTTGIFAISGTQAPFNGNYAVNVSASPTGSGIVRGGGAFASGSIQTVTATANPGYTFANWTLGGNIVSTTTNYTFIVNGGENLVANFIAPQYSVVVASSPASGGSVSGGRTYPANSQQTLTATPAANFEFIGWTGNASGTNNPLTITVYTNLNITANFAEVMTGVTLTLLTNSALGTVTPNPNGRLYRLNQSVTLTAVPRPGDLFSNWTGSVTTNKNPLTIKLDSSKVIEANFISNPFTPIKGTYNGLFTATNAVISEQTAGMLKGLTVGTKGAYSGTLMINGAGHGLSGTFSLGLQASNKITRPSSQGGNLIVQLTLNPGPPPQITGTITGTNWLSINLLADLASNVPSQREYTINILPTSNNPASNAIPGGTGYALVTNHLGAVKLVGALADGTAFSQSVPASAAGDVPVYASLYANKGLLLGWINLDVSNAPGSLAWIHPAQKTGQFTAAFTSTNAIALSPWTNPPAASALPTNLLFVEMTNGVPTATNAFAITVSNNFKIGAVSGPLPLNGTINPKTGLVTVSIGAGAEKQTASGALLLSASNSSGYFVTKTNAGAILLSP